MGMMSANLPYPVSSLVDTLSVLELASEPVKLKKAIKELHVASVEFKEMREELDAKNISLDKKEAALAKSIVKSEEVKSAAIKASEKLAIESESFKLRDEALRTLEVEMAKKLSQFEVEKLKSERSFQEAMRNTSEKNNELSTLKAECEKTISEYKEKLSKLKAVIE